MRPLVPADNGRNGARRAPSTPEMLDAFPQPAHMPCPDCGASVPREAADAHVCDPERRLEFQLVQLREELQAFDAELAAWLDSPQGRFAAWVAERGRGA